MYTNSSINITPKEDSLIKQMISKLIPYWPVFISLIMLFVGATYGILKTVTPAYRSSATILINDERKGAEESKMMESFDYFSSKKIVENEIEVIRSRALLSKVIKVLNLQAPVFEKGTFRFISAYESAPIIIEVENLRRDKNFHNFKKIPFSFVPAKNEVVIQGKIYPINKPVLTPFGTLKFIKNLHKTVDPLGPIYFSLIYLNELIADLNDKIAVTPVSKLSSVVTLDIEDEVPQRGNDILNVLTQEYYSSSASLKNEAASNTLKFIQNRIGIVEASLDSLERLIQSFKTKKGVVDLSAQGRQFIENVGSNDQKIGEINMQLAVLDEVERYVVSKNNKAGIVPSTLGVTDPVLIQLLQQLYQSENEYERLKGLTAENNPMLVSLRREIEQIRPGILENIRNQRKSLQAGKTNFSTTNGVYNSALGVIPAKEKALLDLTRQQGIVSSVYTFLLQKREETALSFASNITGNKIVDTAAATVLPVKPNKILFYAVAVVLAFAFGAAIVVGKEKLGRNVLYRSEIERLTGLPVVGEFNFDNSGTPLVVRNRKRSEIGEQFGKLSALILSGSADRNWRKILITSGVPGDGKSFVAANLGLSMAKAGKRVVLVELDLYHGSLSHILGYEADFGISDFLQGGKNPRDVVRQTDVDKNLYAVAAGKLQDNTADFFKSGKLAELMDILGTSFDYVIVDTAPVGALADAYLLSPLCDLTLFMVRHNHTPRALLESLFASNDIYRLGEVKILFNGVKDRGFGRNSYRYGYGYGQASTNIAKAYYETTV